MREQLSNAVTKSRRCARARIIPAPRNCDTDQLDAAHVIDLGHTYFYPLRLEVMQHNLRNMFSQRFEQLEVSIL